MTIVLAYHKERLLSGLAQDAKHLMEINKRRKQATIKKAHPLITKIKKGLVSQQIDKI